MAAQYGVCFGAAGWLPERLGGQNTARAVCDNTPWVRGSAVLCAGLLQVFVCNLVLSGVLVGVWWCLRFFVGGTGVHSEARNQSAGTEAPELGTGSKALESRHAVGVYILESES